MELQVAKNTEIGVVALKRSPLISGRVVEAHSGAPLPGAIAATNGKTLGISDGNGDLRIELPDGENPPFLAVSFAGYGTRIIALAKGRSDQTLSPIELGPAGMLFVKLPEKHDSLSLELKRVDGRNETTAQSGRVDGNGNQWKVDNLDAGEYRLLIGGSQPLQHFGASVKIRPGETTEFEFQLSPIDLTTAVFKRAVPVPGAEVTLKSSVGGWTSTMVTGSDGTFHQELWQGGRLVALVSTAGLSEPYLLAKEIGDSSTFEWDIQVPAGSVTGHVLDRRSHQPVPGATVTLEETHDDTTKSIGYVSDDSGTFAFEGVEAGSNRIYAEASGFLKSAPQDFVLASSDEERRLDIQLDAASEYPFVVVGPNEQPIVAAAVVQAAQPPGPGPVTDISGRVDVDIDRARSELVAFLPKNGSFGLYRIPANPDIPSEATRVVVMPPVATLTIRTVDEATGLPVRNVHLMIRYNREFVDPSLAQLISAATALPFITNYSGQAFLASIPSGTYDVWPYGSMAEAQDIMRGTIPAAASISVVGGDYTATLKFRSASSR